MVGWRYSSLVLRRCRSFVASGTQINEFLRRAYPGIRARDQHVWSSLSRGKFAPRAVLYLSEVRTSHVRVFRRFIMWPTFSPFSYVRAKLLCVHRTLLTAIVRVAETNCSLLSQPVAILRIGDLKLWSRLVARASSPPR